MQQENPVQKTHSGTVIIRKIRQRKYGDVVEIVAKPIARVIDAALGTDMENCGGCAARKEKFNRHSLP
jgi:hypothetical protein